MKKNPLVKPVLAVFTEKMFKKIPGYRHIGLIRKGEKCE